MPPVLTNALFEGHPVSSYSPTSLVHREPSPFLNRSEFQNYTSYTQLKSVCFVMAWLLLHSKVFSKWPPLLLKLLASFQILKYTKFHLFYLLCLEWLSALFIWLWGSYPSGLNLNVTSSEKPLMNPKIWLKYWFLWLSTFLSEFNGWMGG